MYPARTLNDLKNAAGQANINATALICLRYLISAASGTVSLGKVNGIKGRIVDAKIISRDGSTTPTIQIKGGSAGTTVLTNAMTKSATTGQTTVANNLADVDLADGDTLNAVVSSGSTTAEVILLIAPTQIPA